MFTGIVQATGRIVRVKASRTGRRLTVDLGSVAQGVKSGDSVAVNGCCLTVAKLRANQAEFDIVPETLRLTTFDRLHSGDRVNLERASRIGDRLDGHIVQGHVDGLATVVKVTQAALKGHGPWGQARTWTLRCDPALTAQMVLKGSVALDGISLTIASLEPDRFSVAIIPETLKRTTLGAKLAGSQCHVELDVLGKYVHRLLAQMSLPAGRGARRRRRRTAAGRVR